MDIVNYIRTLADKLGEQNKPSTDYSDTEKKIAETQIVETTIADT